MKNIFITGVNTGLGNALAVAYLERGYKVYALGRDAPAILDKNPNFFFFPFDLSETYTLKETIREFIQKRNFEIAILNAGVLGEIGVVCLFAVAIFAVSLVVGRAKMRA